MRSESTESMMPVRRARITAPGVAGGDALHAGAHDRRLGAQQRNRLALHVGAHQGAVGVVVLQERNQRGSHRHQLLRADVDVVHLVAADQNEVAGLAGVHQFGDDLPFSSSSALAWAMTHLSSSHADR